MRIPSLLFIFGLLFGTFVIDLSCASHYVLPKNPKTPVIVLFYKGGYSPPRISDEPDLQILSDGTVILGAPFGQKKRIESKINQKQLQELLKFLFDDQKIAEFNAKKVQDAIKAEQVDQERQGQAMTIADVDTTFIHIHANGKIIETNFYALPIMAQQYPAVKELDQLETARRHLEGIRAEVYAGGKEDLARFLKLANQQLEEQYPNVPSLTSEDLQSAWQFANGNAYVGFSRIEQLSDGRSRVTSVNIDIPSGQNPQVTVALNSGVKE